ncbi:hypothetical protein D3C87_242160 [compost metagenome]
MALKIINTLGSVLIVTSSIIVAQESQAKNFESKFFEALVQQQVPAKKGTVQARSLLTEVADGLNTKEITTVCDPRRFEDSVMDSKISTQDYYQAVKDYFKRCGSELARNSPLGMFSLIKFSMFEYSILSHPQIKEFVVTLDSGVKVPALLAMKADSRPRPLVIVRCGVFCSAEASPTVRSYLMQLFDQTPFNVLFLANQTGIDYIALNRYFTMGGWSEGYESIEVGRWMLEKWEHRKSISSLHLMGISLGGNAAVMGAAYNDQFTMESGRRIFNSVAAICPVVSLKPTLDNLYGSQIVGRIFNGMTRGQLLEARKYVADIPDLLEDSMIPVRKGMADYIGEMAAVSLQRRGVASTPQEFFKNNNFFTLKRTVATPLMVWASKDDMVVDNSVNAAILDGDVNLSASKNTGVVNLPYGNHCAFNAAYGAAASAAVMRTFVLNNSPEFRSEYQKQKMAWNFGYKKVSPMLEHVGQSWVFSKKSPDVKVRFKYFNWSSEQCYDRGPWTGDLTCLETRDYTVPISALKAMGARVPRSTAEAQALSREFNTKVEFRTKSGPLNGTSSSNFHMIWRSGY